MAPVRVRGCAGPVLPVPLADASRRQNGPRKATFRRLITVRLRSKSCLPEGPYVPRPEEKGSSGIEPRTSQQANVGSKTRSAERVPTEFLVTERRERVTVSVITAVNAHGAPVTRLSLIVGRRRGAVAWRSKSRVGTQQ